MPSDLDDNFRNFEFQAKEFFTNDAFVQSRVEFFAGKFDCDRDLDNDSCVPIGSDSFSVKLAFRTQEGFSPNFFISGVVQFDQEMKRFTGFTAFVENVGMERTEFFDAFENAFIQTA